MSNKVLYQRPIPGLLGVTGQQDTARGENFPIYEGLVVDVILDHTHPDYSRLNASNVGSVRVRLLDVDPTLNEDQLSWADPLDYTFYEMPLIGEMVLIHKLRGRYFYSKKISFTRKLPESAFINLGSLLGEKGTNAIQAAMAGGDSDFATESHRFGQYWRPDVRVRQLKHFEGDILWQGRMGHSIRFGSSKMDPTSEGLAPNIILRTGQGKDLEEENRTFDSEFGLILEDVNKDASSVWMVSDQTIPFEPTTLLAGSFYRSIEDPVNAFSGASILQNSDRILLNAKKSHIMLFSNEEIYLNSFRRTSIDTDDSIMLTANLDIVARTSRDINLSADNDYSISAGGSYRQVVRRNTSLLSDKIFIGSSFDNREPLVGGTSLSIFLGRLIIALMGNPTSMGSQSQANSRIGLGALRQGLSTTAHVITSVGPGRLSPAVVAALTRLYNELQRSSFSNAPFNSEDNFVNLQNETPRIELNEFEEGEQIETENNEWILSEPYYRIE